MVWYFAGQIRASPALPSPMSVLQTFWELARSGILTKHILASLEIILLGIVIAVFLDFVWGF